MQRSPRRRCDPFLSEISAGPVEQLGLAASESGLNVYLSAVAMKTKQWSLSRALSSSEVCVNAIWKTATDSLS